MNSLYNIWNKIILLLFAVSVLFLIILGLFSVADLEWVYLPEATKIIERSPIVTLFYIFLVTLFFTIIGFITSLPTSAVIKKYCLPLLTIIVHSVIALIWITNNTYPPDADQKTVCDAAMAMEANLPLANPEYFIKYPFNEGILYAIRLSMKITGIIGPLAWRYINVLAVIAIDIAIILLTKEIAENNTDVATNIVSAMLIPFVPLVFYSTFVYGTLVSMALTLWAFWGTIRMLKTRKMAYCIVPVLCLPLANRIYSGTVIATIAVSITLFFEFLIRKGKEKVILIASLVSIIFLFFVSGSIMQFLFYQETGISKDSAGYVDSPACYIYVGIAEEKGVAGPGSYSTVCDDIYEQYGEETGKYVLDLDIQVIKEYLQGKRSLNFFTSKTQHQWLDPWFGGLTMTCYPWSNYEVSESFYNFLHSPTLKLIYKYWLRNFVPFVYAISIVASVFLFKKDKANYNMLLLLYFVGGFTFQMFWESKSRYCFPYFMVLFPLVAWVISHMAQSLNRKCH